MQGMRKDRGDVSQLETSCVIVGRSILKGCSLPGPWYEPRILVMIGLVWLVAGLSVAALGNLIVEFAVRPFTRVGDYGKVRCLGPWSRLDFFCRSMDDDVGL